MNCFFCKGTLISGTTSHVSDFGERTIIIKGVPCLKCDQCLEIVYSGDVYEQVEQILTKMKSELTEIAIIRFDHKAA